MSYKLDWINWDNHLSINYNKVSLGSFRDELVNNATAIRENFAGQLDLLFSGGMSSQVALFAFQEAGIPVNLITGRFSNLNSRDVDTATRIADKLSVPIKIIDIDVDKFFNSEAEERFNRFPCFNLNKLLITKILDYCDHTPIIGGKEPQVFRASYDYSIKETWQVKFTQEDFYFDRIDRDLVPNWSMYSPEVLLSMLLENKVKETLENKNFGKISLRSTQDIIYKQMWPLYSSRLPQSGLEQLEFPWLLPESAINFFKEKVQKNKKFISPVYFSVRDFVEGFN